MMSRDRVRFRIPVHRYTIGSKAKEYRQALKEAFDLEMPDYTQSCPEYQNSIQIICRPSQFARFLIIRYKLGVQNQFSELEPVLFTPETPRTPKIIDVSGNGSREKW